jgi:hypothetical protein
MSNTLSTIDMVAKEALRIAHEKATFVGTTTRSYDDSYAKTGAKIGDTLRLRNPNQYTVTTASRVMDAQDQEETTQSLTVASQYHVDMRFNSTELALSIDELSKRYIEPAMSVLTSRIDGDCLLAATQATYNVAGTAGTAVGTVTSGFSDTSAIGIARARLNQGLAPKDGNRFLQLDSGTMASLTNGIKPLFSPQGTVEEAFREGYIGKNQMATFYENDRTYTHTTGSDVTVNTSASAAVTNGGTNITMNSTDGNINKGDVFTVAGVFACHPETKQSLGYLQQFVATAASTGAVAVSPPTFLSGAKQNVCSSAGAVLVTTDFNSKAMTFVGTASTAYRQNLMYHKEAFAFVTADLPLMDDAIKCTRMNQDGLSLRVWQASDIRNDEMLMRIDILWGFLAMRPAWASRITN